MSYQVAVAWSVMRALLVAGMGTVIAEAWVQRLAETPVAQRFRLWAVLLPPLFTPVLWLGFGYRELSLQLVHYRGVVEGLYALIVLAQTVPIAVLLLTATPPPTVSASAQYLAGNSRTRALQAWPVRFSFWLRGPWPRRFVAGAAVFLVCFQEAELAALMQTRGWPEWLFAQQAGGIVLSDTWGYVSWPVAISLLVVAPAVTWQIHRVLEGQHAESALAFRPALMSPLESVARGWTPWRNRLLNLTIVAGWALTIVLPGLFIAPGVWHGWPVLLEQSAFWRELSDAVLLGLTSGLLAWLLLDFMMRRTERRALALAGGLLAVPGLLGALALGLSLKELFDYTGRLSATPGPLVLALVLYLFPRALLLSSLLSIHADRRTPAHLVELLRNGSLRQQQQANWLLWMTRTRHRFWGIAVVCAWAYLELTLTTLLRPGSLAPAPIRLYNFLHYSRIPGLSALLCVTLLVPVSLIAGSLLIFRPRPPG